MTNKADLPRTVSGGHPSERPSGTAVYVQVPFCPERCDYCAIPVTASLSQTGKYLAALEWELSRVRPFLSENPPLSLYIGGGSPTSLPTKDLKIIVDSFSTYFKQAGEVTFESRPEALTEEKIALLGTIPRLRLSVGMESLDPASLASLGRRGPLLSPLSLLERLKSRLDAAVSMDFICTGEGFDEEEFLAVTGELLAQGLDHLSVYPLVIEKRTVLSLRKEQGQTDEALEDRAAENWRRVCQGLARQGWLRYEVSNFARDPERICRHNLHVWKGGDYLGLGPGAHQKVGVVRYENVRSIVEYVDIVLNEGRHPMAARECLSERERDTETLYTNLRLSSGISIPWILDRTDNDRTLGVMEELVRIGLAEIDRTNYGSFVLSEEGLFVLDEIAFRLLALFPDGDLDAEIGA